MAEKKTESKAERIEIGFDGGQVIASRVEPKALEALLKAAESGEGWHTLKGEEGSVFINLEEIVFIRTANPEQRVGFGLGS
jgi:hypothetical protein